MFIYYGGCNDKSTKDPGGRIQVLYDILTYF